jgi:hypothetical protein
MKPEVVDAGVMEYEEALTETPGKESMKMDKPEIYLETTMFSFYYEERTASPYIARTWTIDHVRRVNRREGYQGIGIYKPAEVLEIYEDDTRLPE